MLTLDPPKAGRYYVVECSSYQIDLAPTLNPTAGILLNLTPDHLDRHGTMQHYAAIKERLVAGSDTAVVGVDDVLLRADRRPARARRQGGHAHFASGCRWPTGYFADGTNLMQADARALSAASPISMASGRCAASTMRRMRCRGRRLPGGRARAGEIQPGLASFPGLKHRMQPVGRKGNVLFVNDSKATNADAAAPALSSYERIYWIAGGLPKEGGIATLRASSRASPRPI